MRSGKPTILPRISSRPPGSSPYTYAYESLNGNGGNSLQNGWRTVWAWRRLLVGGTVLLLLAWIGLGSLNTVPEEPLDIGYSGEPPFEIPEVPRPKPHPPSSPPRPPPSLSTRPILSFATDPNPSSTEQCTTAYVHSDGSRKPLVQWALMIDAGSTGSRIHVYKFNNCGSSPSFEYEVFKQTRPGLSSYAKDSQKAAESLDPLMEEAKRVVPSNLWKCTPVAVKATAGLRLLGAQESDAILEAVKRRLQTNYEFSLIKKDGVVIMDGKDEGVYAWITANYLLNTLPSGPAKNNGNAADGNAPYAVLDLGGASTQIVFKPSFDKDGDGVDDGKGLEEGEHKYDLHFAGSTHVLYQHSYLGYGLMRARAGVHRIVEFMSSYATSTSNPRPNKGLSGSPDDDEEADQYGEVVREDEVPSPCISRGLRRTIEVNIGRDGAEVKKNVTMSGGDVGAWGACNRVIELVMAKDAVCHLKPCSFNGVYQPSLLDSFASGPVLLLSYFYDRLAPLLAPPPKPVRASPSGSSSTSTTSTDPTEDLVFPISLIKDLARVTCEGPTAWRTHPFPFPSSDDSLPKKWGDSEELMDELAGRPEYCLDLSFMYALLRLGYEFGEERGVRIGKQVRGTELGWCLGATLGLLGGPDFECRA
ncbi:Guanosine-diphosphatase [Serendipita sp. 405]|nr:Guanosine-diphosphatase [Serendipita sp. 397]KAG8879509.1 Guanosine-diphosphatase [Serendipita sp. 405]